MVGHARSKPGGLILDVATGTAGVALELRATTGAQVVGADLTAAMLAVATAKLARRDEHGVHLVQARGESLPFADNTFDSVTFTYLLRYVDDPAATIAELARVLAPGGVLANLEFTCPRLGGGDRCGGVTPVWCFPWRVWSPEVPSGTGSAVSSDPISRTTTGTTHWSDTSTTGVPRVLPTSACGSCRSVAAS